MLNPGYTLPTRKTLSESLISKIYNKILEAAKKQIAKAVAVSITTDAWTSIVNDGYIAITAHFIGTETYKVYTVMIGCIEFQEKHTISMLYAKSERLLGSKIHRMEHTRVEQLRLAEWNGFVELTDECCFGLALFKLKSPNVSTTIAVPLKDHTVEREIRITFLKDISVTRIAFADEGYVSMPMPYIDAFNRRAIMQYVHESRLVSGLIRDIHDKKSARDRWIPNFINGIEEIEYVLNEERFLSFDLPPILHAQEGEVRFRTIGQYLLLAMCERMRRRTNSGIGLRCLFYAISLIARFAMDGNETSLSTLIIHVALWISEGTCDDCLIKLMRLLRGKTQCEYNLHLGDSFSKYITFKNCDNIDMNFGTDCSPRGMTGTAPDFQRITVRTIGMHGFLTSPEAGKRTIAYIQFTEDYPTSDTSCYERE
ncbi:hypothetical protein PYW08_006250 [Mythimna loreyi]|uniref:Uncharacterized protein n=1 Tax=Mythimna loreyi TaxID=667449 RepID=A0ACC2QMM2_9NEOP|nr:hypothetical protein PYW08_006250 [Mythimna loreyi]